MIKNILVPASGSPTDQAVFGSALALARPFGAHLSCLHVQLSTAEAAPRAPHVDFCMGPALSDALLRLNEEQAQLSSAALLHFKQFCARNNVALVSEPKPSTLVTASWREETDHAAARLMLHARHSDAVVLGRPHRNDYLPRQFIEDLLMGCGRPVLIAPESPPQRLTGTVAVGWKETPEAARALTAAMPILRKAKRVVLLHMTEQESSADSNLDDLARQLGWHGIDAEAHVLARKTGPAAVELPLAAAEFNADLLVVGGFGRGPLRELVFGGVTRSLIDQAELAVFMLH